MVSPCWPAGGCADEIEETGVAVGQIAGDFVQLNQFGDSLRLYDFCDRYVLLVGAAFW